MANNNVLSMREEEMDEAVNGLEKCSTGMESTGRSIPNKFRGMRETGLFGNGINTINKQVNSITNSIFNVKNIVRKHSNEMFELDRKMAEKANQIEIPQDFVKNDSRQVNTFNDILMEKIDGRSVNEGGELRSTKEMDESSIGTMQNLTDITSNLQTKEEKLDDSTIIIGKETMQNINNDGGMVDQKYNDASNVTLQNISNINNNQNLSEQKLNDSSSINAKAVLNAMGTAQDLSEQRLNDFSSINNRTALNNIDQGSSVQEIPELGAIAGATGASIVSDDDKQKANTNFTNFDSIQNVETGINNTIPNTVLGSGQLVGEAVQTDEKIDERFNG